MANINFTVGAKLDRAEMNKILSDLNRFRNEAEKQLKLDGETFIDVADTIKEVDKLTKAIEKSFNSSMNRLDTKKLTSELSKVGLNIDGIAENMEHTFSIPGITGVENLRKLGKVVDDVNFKFQKTESVVSRAFSTLAKTAQWSMANQFVQQLENSISNAVRYTFDLNESLNNIRVVTGRSAESMVKFSEEANKVARGLGRTTKEYTDASLLYLQQGKTMQEAAKLTEATLVGANITGQSTAETSELLTAALNGYNLEAKEAMYITDVFANVGAKSGADFKELAVGFSKVASMAKTTGVSVEQLTSQLATISTVTREAPESIGTSLKTIYGRMTELRAGKEAEDGWNMGKVQETFQAAGLSMINDEGGLKDVGTAIEEVGEKWGTFNKETQLALTQAMAGARQQNRLIALFNNWDMYQDQLENGLNSQGAAMEQNEIRMDSLEYKSKQLRAAFEAMWSKIVNDEMIGKFLTAVTSLVDGISSIIDAFGGLEGILKTIAPLAAGFLATGFFGSGTGKKVIGEVDGMTQSLSKFKETFESMKGKGAGEILESLKPQKKTDEQKTEKAVSKVLTPEETEAYEKKRAYLATFNEKRLSDTKETLDKIKDLETKAIAEEEKLSKSNAFQKKTDKRAEGVKLQKKREKIEEGPKKGKTKKLEVIDKEIAKNAAEVEKLEKAYASAEKQIKEYREKVDILSESIDGVTEESHKYTVAQVEKTKAEVDSIESTAKWSNRLQVGGQVVAGAGVAITGIVTAMNTYNDNALDFNAQTDAMVAGITSLGSGLMMLPGPWAKVAGAAVMAGAAVAKFIRENTGMGKVIKANEAAIESFNRTTNDLKNDIKDLTGAQGKLTEMQAIADSGIDNTNRERYIELQNEIADLTPELVSHYDSEGNAVIKLNTDIEKLIKTKKEQLKLANEMVLGNEASFGAEYGMILTKGDEMVAKMQGQMQALQEKAMSPRGLSDDETETLQKLQEKYQDTIDKMGNASENIREYVVQPFLDSNEAISNLSPELQGIAARLYDVDTVASNMKIGYEFYETTKSLDVMNSLLDDAKEPATRIGTALSQVQKEAKSGKKESVELLKAIKEMDVAAQNLATNLVLKFDIEDPNQIKKTFKMISDSINPETGILDLQKVMGKQESMSKSFGKILEGELETANKQMEAKSKLLEMSKQEISDAEKKTLYEKELNAQLDDRIAKIASGGKWEAFDYVPESFGNVDKAIAKLEEEKKKVSEAVQSASQGTNTMLSPIGMTKTAISATTEGMGDVAGEERIRREAAAQEEYNEAVKRRDEILTNISYKEEEAIANQEKMNRAIDDYLFDLADSPETFNALVEQYDALYQAQAGFFDALDSDDVDGFFMSFEEEVLSLRETMDEAFDGAIPTDKWAEALSEYRSDFLGAFESMSEETKAIYADLGYDIDDLLRKATAGPAQEEALAQLSEAARKANQEMGRIYMALNKDNAQYYSQFKKLNKDQMNQVRMTTGVMADDYSTLAEYKVALDQWEKDNADVLRNDEVTHYMTTANKMIDAKWQAVAESMGLSEDDADYAEIQAQASAEMAQAAYWSQVIAKGEAEKEVLNAVIKSIEEQSTQYAAMIETGGIAERAAGQAALDELGKLKVKVGAIDTVIDLAKQKVNELTGGSGPDGSNLGSEGTSNKNNNKKPPKRDPINLGGGWQAGIGSTPTTKPTLGPDSGTDGPGVNDGSGGGGGSGKEQEPETVEDIEDKVDVYRDVEAALKEIGRLTSEQVDKEKDMYGETKLSSMQKRLNLLKQEVEWEKKRREISKGELKRISGEIKSNNSGVEFDTGTGVIKNYNQILQGQIDAINAIADTEVDAKNAAIERYETLKALMEEYESHLDTLRSSEQAEREKLREISRLELEKLDYKVQVELDMTELERQTEEFLMKVGDGLGTAMEKFLNTSERVASTIKLLTNSISDIRSMEQHIRDIEDSADLTPEDKLAELKKSKEEMIKFYETAMKYRQELEKMQVDAYKEAGKLLQDHIKQFDDINKELKSMMDTLKLTGQMGNQELVNSIMDTQAKTLDSQLRATIASRDELMARMADLEEGSEQWLVMRDNVQKLDEQILKITNESLKLYQDQLKYTVDNVMKDLESALTNNNTFKEVDAALKKQNADKKEYLSTTEKILSISKLQQKVQKEMEKATDPAVKAKLQKFLEEEVNLLKEKDKLTHYDMERAEKMLGITMKQIALDNARNNKTMMRLVRTSTGNWAYQYVADAEKVEKAQSDLSNALGDLLAFDQKRQEEVQKNMLDAKKDFYKKLEEIMKAALNGEYETQEEFNKAIEDAEKEFNQTMEDLNVSLNTANKNLSESTLAAILDAYKNNHDNIGILTEEQEEFFKKLAETTKGEWSEIRDFLTEINEGNADSFKDKYADIVSGDAEELFNSLQDTFGDISSEWDNSVSDMITSNDNLSQDTNTAIGSIKDAWGVYLDKVEEVTKKAGLDLEGMKDRVDKLGEEQEKLDGKTDKLVGTIMNEVDALQELQGQLDDVFGKYDDLMGQVEDYMKMLDELIIKQQKAMNPEGEKKPTTGGSTGGSSSSGGGSTGGSKPSGSGGGKPNFTTGEAVRVSGDTKYFYDSYGTNPSGTAKAGNKYLIDSYKAASGAPYDIHISNSSGGDLGWVKKGQLQKFDTGGYTGSWGKDGKMAMLHEKEIVLNKSDTKNILDIVKIARQMISSIGGLNLGNMVDKAASNIQQHVTIQAEFPNVNTASEIEKAFANMGNQASQYALQKGRIR